MTKKVTIGAKPKSRQPNSSAADEWVAKGTAGTTGTREETTRYTIDIPVELHARIKSQCALKRVTMRDEIIMLLEKHFGG